MTDFVGVNKAVALFRKTNAKGEPLTCKFCHKPVWWETLACRWYEPDRWPIPIELIAFQFGLRGMLP